MINEIMRPTIKPYLWKIILIFIRNFDFFFEFLTSASAPFLGADADADVGFSADVCGCGCPLHHYSREESVFFVALVGGKPYQSRNKSVQKSSKITYPPKIYHPLPTSQKYYPAPPYKKYRLKGKNGIF